MLENTFFDIVLGFSHSLIFLLILLTGFVLINPRFFFQAACLVAFGIITNVALKGFFKVPLPTHLGPYYAFPSGHMQSATILYVWLAVHVRFLPWRLFVALLLPSIGAGLIYYHYHQLDEVIAGFIFGLIIIALYHYLLTYFKEKATWLLLLIASSLMMYSQFTYTQIPPHAWPAFYTLISLLALEKLFLIYQQKF